MATEPIQASGHCQCGDVHYAISGVPVMIELCHCESCRGTVGAPLMAWTAFARDGFEWTAGAPTAYQSSPGVTRTFCGRCGTSLTLADARFADEIYVSIASFAEPETQAPEFHIWRSHRLPWLETADTLPRYVRFKSEGELEPTLPG